MKVNPYRFSKFYLLIGCSLVFGLLTVACEQEHHTPKAKEEAPAAPAMPAKPAVEMKH